MAIHPVADGLARVDLDLPREGFRSFIGCWVMRRRGATLVVDPGPRATVPALLEALEGLGVDRVDRVLLTHIHLDHAGGAGLLLDRYPEAQVRCHPAGVPHLVDPAKLWAGSQKILGDLAHAYGAVAAVPETALGSPEAETVGGLAVGAVETPGHAAHHRCYLVDGVLFAGEVAGVWAPTPAGPYQRPATPPVFRHEVSRASLEAATALGAALLCPGHGGPVYDPRGFFAAARTQLDRWFEVVTRHAAGHDPEPFEAAVIAELLATDPWFGRFANLPLEAQQRERYFIGNTLGGMRSCALEG